MRNNDGTVQFKVLNLNKCERLHSAILETMENVGVIIHEKKALEMLKKAGAVIDGNLAKIPSFLVEKSLKAAPSSVVLYDRTGKPAMHLGGNNFYFGPGPSTTYTIDPYTGVRRSPKKEDTKNVAKVVDALENIDFVMDFGTICDVPTEFADIHMLQALLENTTKPIVHWGFNAANCQTLIDMCIAVAGSEEELQKAPFICLFSVSNTPLQHSEEAIQKLMFMAEHNLPAVYVSAPMAGGTSPVSMAGTLVVSIAECLTGLVISQLVREGAPFIMGGVPAPIDMHTMVMSYGSPEFSLMHAAFAEMAHYYTLPMWGTAGCTDSKVLDQQAAMEAMASIMTSAMSGANLIHDVGYMEGGSTSHLGQLVMSNEIIGFVKRIVRGINLDDSALALDIIKEVGPAGEYVTHEHTYRNFRKELWIPELTDRKQYDNWVLNGRLTLAERAMAKTKEIIENHHPEPLDAQIKSKIAEIVNRACN